MALHLVRMLFNFLRWDIRTLDNVHYQWSPLVKRWHLDSIYEVSDLYSSIKMGLWDRSDLWSEVWSINLDWPAGSGELCTFCTLILSLATFGDTLQRKQRHLSLSQGSVSCCWYYLFKSGNCIKKWIRIPHFLFIWGPYWTDLVAF